MLLASSSHLLAAHQATTALWAQRPKTGTLRLPSSLGHAQKPHIVLEAYGVTIPTRRTTTRHSHVRMDSSVRRHQHHHSAPVGVPVVSSVQRVHQTRTLHPPGISVRGRAMPWRRLVFLAPGPSTTQKVEPTLVCLALEDILARGRVPMSHDRAYQGSTGNLTKLYRVRLVRRASGIRSMLIRPRYVHAVCRQRVGPNARPLFRHAISLSVCCWLSRRHFACPAQKAAFAPSRAW